MDSVIQLRRVPGMILLVLVFSMAACTLRVEKIKPYGTNDQRFDFDYDIGSWQDSIFLFCCNGTISTPEGGFDKGDYQIILVARGSQAAHVYPAPKILLNHKTLGEVQLDSSFNTYRIPFRLEKKILSAYRSFLTRMEWMTRGMTETYLFEGSP